MTIRNMWKELLDESEIMDYYTKNNVRAMIIGFGKMGLLHGSILNLLKPSIVVGVVDKSKLLTFLLKKVFTNVTVSRSIDELIEEKLVNTVYITTPTSSHYSLTKKLIELNVSNIFVEKPPTVNSNQLRDLINKKKPGTIVMFGFQKRFALTFRHAKQLLSSGALGEIYKVESYIRSGDIVRETTRFKHLGRGVLLDLGVHLINLLQWIFNPVKILSANYKSKYTGVDDEFNAELEDKAGFPISFSTSWIDQRFRLPETMIHVIAEKGELWVTEDHLRINWRNGEKEAYYRPHYYSGYPPVNLADQEYTIEDIHFLNSIATRTNPKTSLEDGLKTMMLIDKLYRVAGAG